MRLVQLMRRPSETGRNAPGQWQLFRTCNWDWLVGTEQNTTGNASDSNPLTAVLGDKSGSRELARRIKRLWRQNEFRGKELVVGLSGPEVQLHALELPIQHDANADDNLRQAAHWEIERLMSLPQGEVETDFWLLPTSKTTYAARKPRDGSGQNLPGQPTAIGVAARKTLVSGIWKICESAGLRCRCLDANLCAISRLGAWVRSLPMLDEQESDAGESEASESEAASEIWGLLDLGYTQTRLAICVASLPVLVRSFDTGGRRWIERITESLELSVSAAEIHLRDHGIQPPSRNRTDDRGRGVRHDGSVTPSAQLGSIIRNILGEELELLCGEIERSYRYALQCYPGHRVSELILVGGAAEMPDLDEYLKSRLGIEVHTIADRLERTVAARRGGGKAPFTLTTSGHYPLGALACAIGLAIPPSL